MACPHFSRQDSECLLRKDQDLVDEEMGGQVEPDEVVDLTLCLAPDPRYRACPVYRSVMVELLP
jgi:hypothetical protein